MTKVHSASRFNEWLTRKKIPSGTIHRPQRRGEARNKFYAKKVTGISPVANIFTLALDERAPHGFTEDVHPIRARAAVRTKRGYKALAKGLAKVRSASGFNEWLTRKKIPSGLFHRR